MIKDSVFVIRDHRLVEGLEGAFTEVSSDMDKAIQFIEVITQQRKPIVLNGITRIVGYYSRVNNWNKSKVGELRDRYQQNYALGG